MSINDKHQLHAGELLVQKRRNTPSDLAAAMPDYITQNMPQQHAEFYAGLSYLPLATLDDRGRPWISMMVTSSNDDSTVGIQVFENNKLNIVAETNPFDPIIRALDVNEEIASSHDALFASVGVDFSNRRRNKLAGSINTASVESTGKVNLELTSDQHLGNCPKYITMRSLEHQARNAKVLFDSWDSLTLPLPEHAKALMNQSSTVFLATRHTSEGKEESDDQTDMGVNHRGGSPGFIRSYEETQGNSVTTYLVLPDHSGNRFYQSLGNIQSNKQVGLVFPDFKTGDVLYITGDAENLFDEEAEVIMPRVSLITRIQVTGAVLVKSGLNLRLISDEQHSPYNPPVRHLRHELEEMGHSADFHANSQDSLEARLTSVQNLSDTFSTFTFELSDSIDTPPPGGFGVFDFSQILDTGYSHMNEANPQLVNEDYVRTWTLSSAAAFSAENNEFLRSNQISVTVKRKVGGLISNFLHDVGAQSASQPMQVVFKGTGAGFSCFRPDPEGGALGVSPRMLWVAGGAGITPFMSMWDGIRNVANALPESADGLSTDIVLLFSGRHDDVAVLRHFLADADLQPDNVCIKIFAYQSSGESPSKAQAAIQALPGELTGSNLEVAHRRLRRSDIQAVEYLLNRDVFLCGPDALMTLAETTLNEFGVDQLRVHKELFFF